MLPGLYHEATCPQRSRDRIHEVRRLLLELLLFIDKSGRHRDGSEGTAGDAKEGEIELHNNRGRVRTIALE